MLMYLYFIGVFLFYALYSLTPFFFCAWCKVWPSSSSSVLSLKSNLLLLLCSVWKLIFFFFCVQYKVRTSSSVLSIKVVVMSAWARRCCSGGPLWLAVGPSSTWEKCVTDSSCHLASMPSSRPPSNHTAEEASSWGCSQRRRLTAGGLHRCDCGTSAPSKGMIFNLVFLFQADGGGPRRWHPWGLWPSVSLTDSLCLNRPVTGLFYLVRHLIHHVRTRKYENSPQKPECLHVCTVTLWLSGYLRMFVLPAWSWTDRRGPSLQTSLYADLWKRNWCLPTFLSLPVHPMVKIPSHLYFTVSTGLSDFCLWAPAHFEQSDQPE